MKGSVDLETAALLPAADCACCCDGVCLHRLSIAWQLITGHASTGVFAISSLLQHAETYQISCVRSTGGEGYHSVESRARQQLFV